VGFDRDDADSVFGEKFWAHVAAAFGPFVAFLSQHGADQADQGRAAGRNSHDVGVPTDFANAAASTGSP
jgi:hypothetical protein